MKKIIVALLFLFGSVSAHANFTADFEDTDNGVTYTGTYWTVTLDNYTYRPPLSIILRVYPTRNWYVAGKRHIKAFRLPIVDPEIYSTYFSTTANNAANKNSLKSAQTFLNQLNASSITVIIGGNLTNITPE